MDDFEGDQLVIGGGAAGDEEEGGVAAVDDLGVWDEDKSGDFCAEYMAGSWMGADLCTPGNCTCGCDGPGRAASHP